MKPMTGAAPHMHPNGTVYIGVGTGYTAAGSYACTLSVGHIGMNDEVDKRILDSDAATAYASEIAYVSSCAWYDAAIFAQLKKVGIPMPMVGHLMRTLRNKRRPYLEAATYPLRLAPIVSKHDYSPRIMVRVDGFESWSWHPDDAMQHASQVLLAVHGATMDTTYLALLQDTSIVGLDPARAHVMVQALRDDLQGLHDMNDTEPPTEGPAS